MSARIIHGDVDLGALALVPDESIDAVVTDPPYGIGFMGEAWDGRTIRDAAASEAERIRRQADRGELPPRLTGGADDTNRKLRPRTASAFATAAGEAGAYDFSLDGNRAFQAWVASWARELVRVLRPGGHAVVFGGTRTYHRAAAGLEDAGFEIRDSLMWLFGSGFPKSLDVGKAIDALDAADERLERARRSQAWLAAHLTPQRVNELTGTDMGHHLTTHPTQPAVPTPAMLDTLRPALPPVPAWLEELVRDRAVESANLAARAVVGEQVGSTNPGFAGSSHRGSERRTWDVTAPATAEAADWHGWGTALKPAFEPIVLARKPFRGTVARNVIAHGTAALNIDATRIPVLGEVVDAGLSDPANRTGVVGQAWQAPSDVERNQAAQRESLERTNRLGRWPANVLVTHAPECVRVGTTTVAADGHWPAARGAGGIATAGHGGQAELDERHAAGELVERWACVPECPLRMIDTQAPRAGGGGFPGAAGGIGNGLVYGAPGSGEGLRDDGRVDADAGASRFFYCPKVSTAERHEGLGVPSLFTPPDAPDRNDHPTVKPIELMRWLCRLVTPAGGTVLDPFTGSGSTGIAAGLEGFSFVGVEREAEYVPIAVARLAHWLHTQPEVLEAPARAGEPTDGGIPHAEATT